MRSMFRPRALRSVQLTIVFTMLALPASAFALPAATGFATTASSPLPVRVTPRHVQLGAPVHVSGRLSALQAGRTVVLEAARSPRGRWHRIARTHVGRHGGFALRVAPRQSGVMRAVELSPVDARPAAVRAQRTHRRTPDAVSRVAAIEVKAAVRVPARARSVVAGQSVDIAGHLAPGRANRTVEVQDRAGRRWQTLGRGRTGHRGGFAVRVGTGSLSHAGLRVVFAGDRFNGRATAAAGSVTVFDPVLVSWYDDAGTTACGFHATYGVANLSLPCGTKVRMRDGARTVTATVDDRGPYVSGRTYDLSQTTAAALGFSGLGTIDASVVR